MAVVLIPDRIREDTWQSCPWAASIQLYWMMLVWPTPLGTTAEASGGQCVAKGGIQVF